jgi:dephospho-CoA kinase
VTQVGLTGGIGSGKSTVAAMLRDLGAYLVDSDEGARAVVEPGTPGFERVVAEFGPGVVSEGRLDRAALAELVFRDPTARDRLNAIVHPLVREWSAQRVAQAAQRGEPVVVHDIPLLFENQLEHLFDAVLLVHVPPDVQLRRLVEGRGFSEADARARIAAQMPIDDKVAGATYVVDNSGPMEATRRQIEEVWGRLVSAEAPGRG